MSRRLLTRSGLAAALAGAVVVVTAVPAAADIPGAGIVREVVSGAGGWAFERVADGIASWVLGAVGFFVDGSLQFLRSSTRPDVEAAWFSGPGSPYATVRGIAAVLLVGFVFLGLLQGLVQGDPIGMLRRVAANLPLAVLGMVVTTAVVARLLDLTDALSEAVLQSTGGQALQFLSGFGATVTALTGGFAAVLLGLVAALAGLVLWALLLIRSSLIYLLVAISPLGFAATLWPAMRGVLRRTVEILLAVIVSKFVVCVVLAIGVAALAGAGEAAPDGDLGDTAGAGLATLLTGAVLLGVAAFSPFLVLRMIPAAETALVAQGFAGSPMRAAQGGMHAYSSARSVGRLSGTGGGSGASGAAAGGSGAGAGAAAAGSGGGAAGASGGGAAGAAAGGPAGVAAAAGGAVATGGARRAGAAVRQATSGSGATGAGAGASGGGATGGGRRQAPGSPPPPPPGLGRRPEPQTRGEQ